MSRNIVVLMMVLYLTVTGCSTTPTESLGEFHPEIYVEGFLRAGKAVDSVFVGTTVPLGDVYDRSLSGLTGASVSVSVDSQSYALMPLPNKPGYYYLLSLIVQPGKTYRLTAQTELGTAVAETTVPVSLTLEASSDVLTINGTPFQVHWEGETEGGYVTTQKTLVLGDRISIVRQFGGFGGLGGFPGGAVDTTAFAAVRDSLARADQWRYVQGQSTTIDSRQFSNYGTYTFLVYAIDSNYADFLISSNQDPQVLDEPRFHVTGGIGIFASMSADSVVFSVE